LLPLLALSSLVFLSSRHAELRHLHFFPTRRSSDLGGSDDDESPRAGQGELVIRTPAGAAAASAYASQWQPVAEAVAFSRDLVTEDRKSTRLNSSHVKISYAVFCLKKKKKRSKRTHT